MKIRLLYFDREPVLLKEVKTNTDGRTDGPLLDSAQMKAGHYRLMFFAREYFAQRQTDCPFLDIVSIDFHVTDLSANYHVPLLVTPWSYSTYRGS